MTLAMPATRRGANTKHASYFPPALVAMVRAIVREELALFRGTDRGPRGDEDMALLAAIAEIARDRSFTSRELIAHATTDPALSQALEACNITQPQELGWVFRRAALRPHAGIRIERDYRYHRAGRLWHVRISET